MFDFLRQNAGGGRRPDDDLIITDGAGRYLQGPDRQFVKSPQPQARPVVSPLTGQPSQPARPGYFVEANQEGEYVPPDDHGQFRQFRREIDIGKSVEKIDRLDQLSRRLGKR